MLRIILFFLLATTLSSCEKEDEVTVINYYITATESTRFDQVEFSFDHTRARRENEIRTVYLDPKNIRLNLSDPDDVFLGSSTIEPIEVEGYDFGFSDFKVIKSGETIRLTQPYLNNNYSESPFLPLQGKEIDVKFILDVDHSIILDSVGQDWIKPIVIIER